MATSVSFLSVQDPSTVILLVGESMTSVGGPTLTKPECKVYTNVGLGISQVVPQIYIQWPIVNCSCVIHIYLQESLLL